jgi:hypothetical protein
MDPRQQELLVVLERDRAATTLDELRARERVVHVASLRVVVIVTDAEPDDAVRGLAGVEGAFRETIPPSVMSSLDEGETLFTNAWLSRQQEVPKPRRGEGLSWDAPGYEPPDPPRRAPRGGSS